MDFKSLKIDNEMKSNDFDDDTRTKNYEWYPKNIKIDLVN
jgi:hypothetical protein